MAKHKRRAQAASVCAGVGLAWYAPDQWAKLKQVAADAVALDESHAAWQRGAEDTERQLRRKGVIVRRVPIDVDSLVAWCESRKKPINGPSRAEYTAELLRGAELS